MPKGLERVCVTFSSTRFYYLIYEVIVTVLKLHDK